MRAKLLLKKMSLTFAVVGGLSLAMSANAMKLKKQNLEQLTESSQSIISGEVIHVSDGFDDKNRPFTEVTIEVSEAAKGNHEDGSTYTFRQFGLLKPRSMGNGKVYLGVSPEGFAKWREGEQVVAFMYKPASLTGFQTTAGMAQGKFVVSNGTVTNQFGNSGLFEGLDTSSLTPEELNLMTTPGAIDAGVFFGLIGKLAGVK